METFMYFCLLSPQFNDLSLRDKIDLRQPMVSSRLGSLLVSRSVLCLPLSAVVGHSVRGSWNGFVSTDPIWFYNLLLSSFRRRRCESDDTVALARRLATERTRSAPVRRKDDGYMLQRRGRTGKNLRKLFVLGYVEEQEIAHFPGKYLGEV